MQMVLGIVGSAFGPIGGFIGSAIGGMIDNLLFPNKQEGPRLSDLTVQQSAYGAVIPLAFGPEVRCAGNVIWSSGLIETSKTEGGGIMGGVELTTYTYRTSVAILLCEGVIHGVRKIWANKKLIYDADEVPPLTVGATPQGHYGPIAMVLLQKAQESHAIFDSVTVYPGDFLQEPDPTIESFQGIGNVPAYRGRAYIVIKDLQLEDYGNALPMLEFLLAKDEGTSVGRAVLDVCTRCGINPHTVSSSMIVDALRGYMIARAASGVGGLQPLGFAFDFDVGEVAGALRFTRRDAPPIAIVPMRDLGGHVGGEDRIESLRWSHSAEVALPREAAITFNDPDRDYQVNSQTARRTAGSADSNINTEVPITLTVDEARRIADRALWEAWHARTGCAAATDDRWFVLEPGRKYLFETPAGLEAMRLIRRTRGANGIIELDLRRDRSEIYRSDAAGAVALIPPKDLHIPGPTELFLLDIPLLVDADDVFGAGFYVAVVGSEEWWRGASILRALTILEPYASIAAMGAGSVAGDVTGTLAAGTETGFDDVTVLTVELRRITMALYSASDDALADGENMLFVGDPTDTASGELLQYGTATLIGPGVYELTHLLRGQRGTEFAIGSHVAGETCVTLARGLLRRFNFGALDLDQEHAFKAVSSLADESAVVAQLFTNTGTGLRPFSPTSLVVVGPTGGDIVLSWTRRSRLQSGDLGEQAEVYRLQIMDALGTTVVREEEVTAASFTYTLAMQTTDFGAALVNIDWRVAQISALYGNGIFATWSGPV